jgi:hypothetical protein
MTDFATAAPPRRVGLRTLWDEVHHSEALKHLLEEFDLWTALWTGFPISGELGLAQDNRSSSRDRASSARRSPALKASMKRRTSVSTSSAVQGFGHSGCGGGPTRVGTRWRAKMRRTRAGAIRGTRTPLTKRSTIGGCDRQVG